MPIPAGTSARRRLGELEVDLRSGEVLRNGDKIQLQRRPFQILVALLQHPGEVVTREEIRQNLWQGDTFVDFEHGINTAIKKLRVALGDDAEHPRFIETLPRYGYRLILPVEILETNGASPGPETPALPPWAENGEMPAPKNRWPKAAIAGGIITLLVVAFAALFFGLRWQRTTYVSRNAWQQITNFPDSATQPVLSPDGHMIAFIRGPETFVTPGQIYVKLLPDGQPIELTHDQSPKMAPVFSPDGSRIAYTATDAAYGWNTWVVPVLGGQSNELLPNAAALTWTDHQHVMFSEIKGANALMGISTAAESRAEERNVYVPAGWGMAHRSWLSPDRKWVLISEMDRRGWMPCRVAPFDGSTGGEPVGPKSARCTYAGWSPDGKTMYFSADAGDGYHIWRQRFPGGVPEQLTFGPTEEEGIAVSPDGQTLVTSAGIRQSTVWVHDAQGDRQVSGEGFAIVPGLGFANPVLHSVFSPDGRKLFYLVRKQGSRLFTPGELWMADLDSGKNQAVLPGVLMTEFDIAPDGERVAFSAPDARGNSHVWLAPIDRRTAPKLLTSSSAQFPVFGTHGEINFKLLQGDQESDYSVALGDGGPRQIIAGLASDVEVSAVEVPVLSPRGDFWLLHPNTKQMVAFPTHGGSAIRICGFCAAGWGSGGRFFYLRFRDIGETGGGKMIAMRLSDDADLPKLPPSGFQSADDVKGANVVAEIDMRDKGILAPGPDPSVYAYTRITVQRNLFRIRIE
jgi:Tol biopolymer transport system component/DNA-binding winged helix-turn-helix (wHTH) protein